MSEISLNQYQELYPVSGSEGVILDFLRGTATRVSFAKGAVIARRDDPEAKRTDEAFLKKLQALPGRRINVVIIPSYMCNLRCTYCYEGGKTASVRRMTPGYVPALGKTIKTLLEKHGASVLQLTLLGGEPLLSVHRPFYEELFGRLTELGCSTSAVCITNGVAVPEYLPDLLRWGVTDFQITVDGAEKTHNSRRKPAPGADFNSFESACRAIDLLLERGRSVAMRVNVDDSNLHDLPELEQVVLKKGWHKVSGFSAYLYPISESGCNSGMCYSPETRLLARVLEVLSGRCLSKVFRPRFHGLDFVDACLAGKPPAPRFNFCGASRNQYVLDPAGIYTCWWGVSDPAFAIGAYSGTGYDVNWERVRSCHARNIANIPECRECRYKYLCGAGCAYKALSKKGKIMAGNCAEFGPLIGAYLRYRFGAEKNGSPSNGTDRT